jgi:hypothetical protein
MHFLFLTLQQTETVRVNRIAPNLTEAVKQTVTESPETEFGARNAHSNIKTDLPVLAPLPSSLHT